MTHSLKTFPSVSVTYAGDGGSVRANELGMRPMQERAYQKRGEQYLLIKSPPASGKSRALMFIALDKLENQGLKKALIVVPEKTIGASLRMNRFRVSVSGRIGGWNRAGISATLPAKMEARWSRCGCFWRAGIG